MFYIRFKLKKLLKNEQITHFRSFPPFGERCERFTHNRLFPLSDVSEFLRSLTKNEQCEQIAQVAHQKCVTMSDSLTSLRGNERL